MLYNSPQTKAREYFVEVDHPVAGKADYPGPPYKWTETPATVRRPAPCLGEHNEEVYCQELGLSKDDLVALRGGGIV
jgi:crotonobetainyl-CoA:carnitine CoA-transferase CaiB-like acyl-CoA transferase